MGLLTRMPTDPSPVVLIEWNDADCSDPSYRLSRGRRRPC